MSEIIDFFNKPSFTLSLSHAYINLRLSYLGIFLRSYLRIYFSLSSKIQNT